MPLHVPVRYHQLGSPDAMILFVRGWPTVVADPAVGSRHLAAIRLLAASMRDQPASCGGRCNCGVG